MKLLLVISMLFSFQAFSQTTKDLIKKLETIELEGNGSQCYLSTYVVKNFDYKKAAKEYVTKRQDGEEILFEFTWAANLSNIEYYTVSEWRLTLKKLMAKKAVKAMFGSGPNPDICTESEYCSLYDLEIFFNEGSKISCDFDFTT